MLQFFAKNNTYIGTIESHGFNSFKYGDINTVEIQGDPEAYLGTVVYIYIEGKLVGSGVVESYDHSKNENMSKLFIYPLIQDLRSGFFHDADNSVAVSDDISNIVEDIVEQYRTDSRNYYDNILTGPSYGIVGYYPFSGNANDASGNGNNGTVNGATLTDDIRLLPNSAYSFDGNDLITCTNAIQTIGQEFTLSALVFATSIATGTKRIFISNTDRFGMGLISGTSFQLYVHDGTYKVLTVPYTSLPGGSILNRWTHTAITYSSGVLKFYSDGQFVSQLTGVGTIAGGNNLLIGNWSSLAQGFIGKIDGCKIYNRALSVEEIELLYSSANSEPLLYVKEKNLSGKSLTYTFENQTWGEAYNFVVDNFVGEGAGVIVENDGGVIIGRTPVIHELTYGNDILKLSYEKDISEIVNSITFTNGALINEVYEDENSIMTYGRRVLYIKDERFLHLPSVDEYCNNILVKKGRAKIKVDSIKTLRSDMKVGDIVTISNWEKNFDDNLYINKITYHDDNSYTLDVGTRESRGELLSI